MVDKPCQAGRAGRSIRAPRKERSHLLLPNLVLGCFNCWQAIKGSEDWPLVNREGNLDLDIGFFHLISCSAIMRNV